MKYISESDSGLFDKDEAATDIDGGELCPICGCCSLVDAEVILGSIFALAEQIQSGMPPERGLVCASGCKKGQPHG